MGRGKTDSVLAGVAGLVLAVASAMPQPVRAEAGAPLANEADRRCLTLAVAYEAASEPIAGQEAVAEVVLNRLAHPSFPKSVCGVVFQGWRRSTGCQFTFTCDGALRRRLSVRTLASARAVADSVLDGAVPRRVPGALNYHADYVRPVWASSLARLTKLGAHIFYRPLAGGIPVGGGHERDWSVDEPDPDVVARALSASVTTGGSGSLPAAPRADQPFAPWGLSLRR